MTQMLNAWLKQAKEENPVNFMYVSQQSNEKLIEIIKNREMSVNFHDLWSCNQSRILFDIMNTAWDGCNSIPNDNATRDQLVFLALVWS